MTTLLSQPRRIVDVLAVASGVLALVVVAAGVPAVSTDDFLRAYLAVLWSKNPALLQVAAWPPLFSAVYGSFMKLPFNPFWVAHALTALFAAISVGLAGRLAAWLASDEWAGVIAAVCVATAPIQIFLSFSMLSEPLYAALLLGFLSVLLRWLETGERSLLGWAAVLCSLMSALRVEAWVWGGLLFVVALPRDRSVRTLFLAALPNLFPLLWLAVIGSSFEGSPLGLFREQAAETAQFYASVPGWRWIPLRTVLFHYTPAVVFFAVALRGFGVGPKRFRAAWIFCAGLWVWQLGVLAGNLMTVFPERSVAVPGLFTWAVAAAGLVPAVRRRNAGILRRGPLLAACAVGVLVNLASLPLLSTTYDRKLTAIGDRLRHAPAFERATRTGGVGSDLKEGPLSHVALISGVAKRFRKIYFQDGRVLLPSSEPPATFLLNSDGVAELLKHKIAGAKKAKLGPFWIVSADAKLFKELALTPERN